MPVVLYKKEFGFATSGSGVTSRTSLYSDTFQDAAKKIGHLVADSKTVHQICSLMVINGRVDHAPGEHDDCVITWLLTYWFLTKAKNLHHYGINSKEILRELAKDKYNTMTAYDRFIEEEQNAIREEMDIVYEQLKKETSYIASQQLENRLRYLNSKVILRENEIYSIDELINNLKDNKRKERREPTQDISRAFQTSSGSFNHVIGASHIPVIERDYGNSYYQSQNKYAGMF